MVQMMVLLLSLSGGSGHDFKCLQKGLPEMLERMSWLVCLRGLPNNSITMPK